MHYDLKGKRLNYFVDFLFDHPVANDKKNEEPWYWNSELEITFDSTEIICLYTRLFIDPSFLLERYSTDQLEQGFWAIQSPNLDCSAYEIIFYEEVDSPHKKECIRSMYSLYENLFEKEPLGTSSFMWWDSFAYGYCCGNLSRENEGEKKLQDWMFETLSRILQLDSLNSQLAALHGLGHLQHPDAEGVINAYLKSHPMLDDKTREYAYACIKGEI